MKRIIILVFALILCFQASIFAQDNQAGVGVTSAKEAPIKAEVLFYENCPGKLPGYYIVSSPESLKKYSGLQPSADFNQDEVLLIIKPGLRGGYSLSLDKVYAKNGMVYVRYIYSTSAAEVMMPAKVLAILIPKTDMPINVIEYEKFEGRGEVSEKSPILVDRVKSDTVWVSSETFRGGSQCNPEFGIPRPPDIESFFKGTGIAVLKKSSKQLEVCEACGCPVYAVKYFFLIKKEDLVKAKALGFAEDSAPSEIMPDFTYPGNILVKPNLK